MRRVAVALAFVSSSIACGGFLGFGEDDEPTPPPAGDGGGDVVTADGGAETDGADRADSGCFTKTFMFGTDAGIVGPLWSKGTLKGGGSLFVENGEVVSRADSDGGPPAEATIFGTLTGSFARIQCSMEVSSSTFASTSPGRWIQFRVEGPQWSGFWETRIGWAPFQAAFQATFDGGASLEQYTPLTEPTPNAFHTLTTDLVLGANPQFRITIDGEPTQMGAAPTGPVTRAAVVLGTFSGAPFETYEVRYRSVACEMCLAQ